MADSTKKKPHHS